MQHSLKFQRSSNLELNSLMFPNYKNTQTGKTSVGISPMEREFFIIIFTQAQYLIPNLLKNVVQAILLNTSMKL